MPSVIMRPITLKQSRRSWAFLKSRRGDISMAIISVFSSAWLS